MKWKFTKRAALILSLAALLVWALLGTGASLAWFTDASGVVENSFAVGTVDLKVQYRNQDMLRYETVTQDKGIFSDGALYEPGYTQVVYLRIENTGDMAFDQRISIDAINWTNSLNVWGSTVHLPDHLKFGVLFDESELRLERTIAQAQATEDLNSLTDLDANEYSRFDTVTLKPGDVRYAALVVYMPENVGNDANYRGTQPQTQLGITVFAQQADTQ